MHHFEVVISVGGKKYNPLLTMSNLAVLLIQLLIIIMTTLPA